MTDMHKLGETWDRLGKKNAFWAILSDKKGWDQGEFFETGRREVRQVLDDLDNEGAAVHFGKALDFGCGVGRLSHALSEHFQQVVGIDIAASMIAQAQELDPPANVEFRRVTSGDLQVFKDSAFDFIFTDIVFQHMSNQLTLGYLKEMYRVLRKGGILVFQIPSHPANTWKGLMIKNLPDSVLTKLRKGMEMNPIRKATILDYLKNIGFEVVGTKRDPNHKHWHAYFYYVRKP